VAAAQPASVDRRVDAVTDSVPTLLTERLRLRGWSEADRLPLVAIKTDPSNWRFIGNGQPQTAEQATDLLAVLQEEWEAAGVGSWAVVVAATGELLGDCGVKLTDRGPQLAYMIARGQWGNGFATEASRAVLGHVFVAHDWPAVYASTSVENIASQRVLEKVGMQTRRTIEGPYGREAWYELRRDEFPHPAPSVR